MQKKEVKLKHALRKDAGIDYINQINMKGIIFVTVVSLCAILNTANIKKQLFSPLPQGPYAYTELHMQQEDSLVVKGMPIRVNGIRCYWKYYVVLVDTVNKPVYNARVRWQQLIKIPEGKTLFTSVESPDNYYNYYSVAGLKNNNELVLACTDINNDKWCDYQILVERAAAGANETYETFLFNPSKKKFEHSALFSGTNVKYDPAANSIYTSWKLGYRQYTYSYIYLKKDKKTVAYAEMYKVEGDTVLYEKIVNKKVVKRTKEFVPE